MGAKKRNLINRFKKKKTVFKSNLNIKKSVVSLIKFKKLQKCVFYFKKVINLKGKSFTKEQKLVVRKYWLKNRCKIINNLIKPKAWKLKEVFYKFKLNKIYIKSKLTAKRLLRKKNITQKKFMSTLLKLINKSKKKIVFKSKQLKKKNLFNFNLMRMKKQQLKKRFIFKLKSKKKIVFNPKAKLYINFKIKNLFLFKKKIINKKLFYYNFLSSIRPTYILYNICLLKIIENKLNLVKKIKNKKFLFKVKKHRKLFLLNIFFNKKKILKPSVNEIKKRDNFKMRVRFIIFFLKKLFLNKDNSNFIIYFKIKKFSKESKIWKKLKKFFLILKFFKRIRKFIKVCRKILRVNLNLKSFYNKTHSHRNLKNKKIRRKKKKKKR